MISVEVKQPQAGAMPDELEIHMDREGLAFLMSYLEFLKEGRTDHVHLMSESWGGADLEDRPFNAESMPIRHVKILLR